ncbi:MAG: ABC transporter ATP-binding protein [Spirochaetes bacterium]|nr:ABC transporter ATP-binding protein [Spirochaetota bacterium]MBU0955138.1 ABC transporter ATP-binding protein [Spirochaetota bacterium]
MTYEIQKLSKRYDELLVLDHVDFSVRSSAVNVVLGPSGCGKTTLLQILAGLDSAYSGSVGELGKLAVSYVFQEDRLLPWLSIVENVMFALESAYERKNARTIATGMLESLGLAGVLHQVPATLSGGMCRRVALARAFAYPAQLMLMDEPFSALDLKTRISVMDSFKALHAEHGHTTILVTHDVREAIYLADTITTLSPKPSKVRDEFTVELPEDSRRFSSPQAAELEARLYASILS